MREKGIFITLEGIDGSGKTTHIGFIKELFEAEGYTVVTTREPGGTPMAEKIRSVLLGEWGDEDVDPLTEVLLFSASRKQHLENFIKPHLEQGHVVISDRYVDSMIAYQGAGRGRNKEADAISEMVCGPTGRPDFVFYFEVSAEVAAKRAAARGEENRLDREALDFKQRALNCYAELRSQQRNRYITINANGSIESVEKELLRHTNNIVKLDLSWKNQAAMRKAKGETK